MSKLDKIRSGIKPITGKMREAHVTTYAASAVYHMVIALAPALMLLVSLVRFLPVTQEEVLKVFSDTLSEQAFTVIDSVASSIFSSTGTTTIISSLLLLVSASGAMRSLMKGLNEAYGIQRKQPFLVLAGRAILYTLLFLIMLVLSLLLLVYGAELLEYIGGKLPDESASESMLSFLEKTRYIILGLILTVVFMFFYHRLPAGKRKFRNQFPGALFSAVSWAVFSLGYSIYVSVSDKFGAYGYLGTLMVVMMWMYYCLLFFMIGGCINVCIEERRGQTKNLEKKGK